MINVKTFTFPLLIIIGIVLLFTGCAVVNITEDLENPFIVNIIWNDEILVPDQETGELPVQTLYGDAVTVKVSVTDEDGNDVVPELYEWYLYSELFEDGKDTVVLDNTLEIGIYWLVVIVGKGSILSSEHVEFTKVK